MIDRKQLQVQGQLVHRGDPQRLTDKGLQPFRLSLDDFTLGEVEELNRRYGTSILDNYDLQDLYSLVGGCPYLVRRGLHVIADQGLDVSSFASEAAQDDGPFGDHLRRLWTAFERDRELREEVNAVLKGNGCSRESAFYRLRSAGVIVGRSPKEAMPRCGLYRRHLEKKLGAV